MLSRARLTIPRPSSSLLGASLLPFSRAVHPHRLLHTSSKASFFGWFSGSSKDKDKNSTQRRKRKSSKSKEEVPQFIPFSISEEVALQRFLDWTRSHALAPLSLQQRGVDAITEFRKSYLPFYSFTAHSRNTWIVKARTDGRLRTFEKTIKNTYGPDDPSLLVYASYQWKYDHVQAVKVPVKHRLRKAVKFDDSTIVEDFTMLRPTAKKRVKQSILDTESEELRSQFLERYPGSRVVSVSLESWDTEITWQQVFLPAFILSYPGALGMTFNMTISGDSGQFFAQRLYDFTKTAVGTGALAAAVLQEFLPTNDVMVLSTASMLAGGAWSQLHPLYKQFLREARRRRDMSLAGQKLDEQEFARAGTWRSSASSAKERYEKRFFGRDARHWVLDNFQKTINHVYHRVASFYQSHYEYDDDHFSWQQQQREEAYRREQQQKYEQFHQQRQRQTYQDPGPQARPSTRYYDLLGVKPTATLEEIKSAFRKKSFQLHPDVRPDQPTDGTAAARQKEEYQEIIKAYQTLRDPDKRRRYDLGYSTD